MGLRRRAWPLLLPVLCCLAVVSVQLLRALRSNAEPEEPPRDKTPLYLRCTFNDSLPHVEDDSALPTPRECPAVSRVPHPMPPGPRATIVPPTLAAVLVIVSFKWNLHKSVHLHSTLTTIEKYETQVDVIINTDRVAAVQSLLRTWKLDFRSIRPLQGRSARPIEVYELLWSYHSLLWAAFLAGNHTAFVYLEDDTLLPWSALVSWAIDTEVLAPLNFTRGIFRTEFRPTDGELVLLDVYLSMNLSLYPRKLDAFAKDPRHFCAVAGRYSAWQCPQRRPRTHRPCAVHRHYVQVTNPFQGMWIQTREQVGRWMASPLWDIHKVLNETFPDIEGMDGFYHPRIWGVPERSNAMPLVVGVPPGFGTNNVVPYRLGADGRTARLSMLAHVEHTRNGYALDPSSAHSRLPYTRALCV
eukprot:EG_transcript_12744